MYMISQFTKQGEPYKVIEYGNGEPITYESEEVCQRMVDLLNDVDYIFTYQAVEVENETSET